MLLHEYELLAAIHYLCERLGDRRGPCSTGVSVRRAGASSAMDFGKFRFVLPGIHPSKFAWWPRLHIGWPVRDFAAAWRWWYGRSDVQDGGTGSDSAGACAAKHYIFTDASVKRSGILLRHAPGLRVAELTEWWGRQAIARRRRSTLSAYGGA